MSYKYIIGDFKFRSLPEIEDFYNFTKGSISNYASRYKVTHLQAVECLLRNKEKYKVNGLYFASHREVAVYFGISPSILKFEYQERKEKQSLEEVVNYIIERNAKKASKYLVKGLLFSSYEAVEKHFSLPRHAIRTCIQYYDYTFDEAIEHLLKNPKHKKYNLYGRYYKSYHDIDKAYNLPLGTTYTYQQKLKTNLDEAMNYILHKRKTRAKSVVHT